MASPNPKQHELRDLADKILALAQGHPAFPQAHRVVAGCTDHLTALAGFHELNARGGGRRRRRRVTGRRRRRATSRKSAAPAAAKAPAAKAPAKAKATKRTSRRRKSALKLVA